MKKRRIVGSIRPIPPRYAYMVAGVIVLVCWYGWTYEVFPYGGDLVYYGPIARVAGSLSKAVTGGLNTLPPQDPLTDILLIWLLWFCSLRLVVAAWNFFVRRIGARESIKGAK